MPTRQKEKAMSFEVSWDDKVARTAKEAERAYEREVKDVSKDIEKLGKKDEHVVKWVEREVGVDVLFAKHHIEYLFRVIRREVDSLDRLAEKIVKAQEAGDTKRVERLEARWDAHYEKGLKHVENVAASVAKHLERDARAAANHIVKGIARISKNDEEFDAEVNRAAEKVDEAIAKFLEDLDVAVEAEEN